MASSDRDDFSVPTKRILQLRVGNLCSNPGCRQLTSGPNHEPNKVSSIGVAAHISGASPGGPRYLPGLSSEERSDSSNGIWLCQNCARLVDVDELTYPTNRLQEWKGAAESFARQQLQSPSLTLLPPSSESSLPSVDLIKCPHCGTVVENGVAVCTGCMAEIYYGSTPREREDALRTGGLVGAVLGILSMEYVGKVLTFLGFSGHMFPWQLAFIVFLGFTGILSSVAFLNRLIRNRGAWFVRYSVR